MIIPSVIQIFFLIFIKKFLPFQEGTFNLILIITFGGFSALIGLTSLFLISKYYRNVLSQNIIGYNKASRMGKK